MGAITVNDHTLKAMGWGACAGESNCTICERTVTCPFVLMLTDPEAVSYLQSKGYTILYHTVVGMWGAFIRYKGRLIAPPVSTLPL